MTTDATAPATVPKTVTAAALLTWIYIGLAALSAILTIVLKDELVARFMEGRYDRGYSDPDQVAPAFVPVAIGGLLIFGVVFALCAVFLTRGAGWARVTLIVFAILSFLGTGPELLQPRPAYFAVLDVLQALVALGILFLLWHGATRAYFRAHKAAKRGPDLRPGV